MKETQWAGDSLEVLKEFPKTVRVQLGQEIQRIQRGREPKDWKPMKSVGPGVREIRVKYRGEYRAFYVTNIGNQIIILHAFRKKTRTTAKKDIELARTRLKVAKKEMT